MVPSALVLTSESVCSSRSSAAREEAAWATSKAAISRFVVLSSVSVDICSGTPRTRGGGSRGMAKNLARPVQSEVHGRRAGAVRALAVEENSVEGAAAPPTSP